MTSCGKRGDAAIATAELPALYVPLSRRVTFGCLDGIEQRFLALDDVNVALILEPVLGTRVRVVEAKVDFWLDGEDPSTYFAASEPDEPWELGAAFDMRLSFGRIDRGST